MPFFITLTVKRHFLTAGPFYNRNSTRQITRLGASGVRRVSHSFVNSSTKRKGVERVFHTSFAALLFIHLACNRSRHLPGSFWRIADVMSVIHQFAHLRRR